MGESGTRNGWADVSMGNDEPDNTRCNDKNQVGDTTPIDRYPRGASSYGLLDMAGNVWEWCEDWYRVNKYRVLRGGAFNLKAIIVRCAYRYRYVPRNRYFHSGFRVVSPGF